MLEFLKNEANMTYTENGAVTFRSTGRDCLDLFATIGALRRESEEEITDRFLRAYAENADLAMKILFYGRDVRGGLGDRRVFRTLLRWLAVHEPKSVIRNLQFQVVKAEQLCCVESVLECLEVGFHIYCLLHLTILF